MERQIYDREGHAYYITFTCYKRRRILDDDRNKKIVIAILHDQLEKQNGLCSGFVVMPDHVHAVIWFPEDGQLAFFMKQWKQRASYRIKQAIRKHSPAYNSVLAKGDPVWQARYYSFNLHSQAKLLEKLEYIHANPVRAALVDRPEQWKYSSARYYALGKSVGLPVEIP